MLLSQQKKSHSIRPEEPICRGPGLSMYCVKRREKRWANPMHERLPARAGSATNAIRPNESDRLHVLSMSGQPSAARHPAFLPLFQPLFQYHSPHSRPAWRQPIPRLSPPRSRLLLFPASPTTIPRAFPPARRSSTNQPARQVRAVPALLFHDRCAKWWGVRRGIGLNSCRCRYPVHDVPTTRIRSDAQPRGRAAAAARRYAGPAVDARRLGADNGRLGVAWRSASRAPAHRVRFYSTS